MISAGSIDKGYTKPPKYIQRLVARSLSDNKFDVSGKSASRNTNGSKAVFHDTQETMFETSPLKENCHEIKDKLNYEANNQYMRYALKELDFSGNDCNYSDKNSFLFSQSSYENIQIKKKTEVWGSFYLLFKFLKSVIFMIKIHKLKKFCDSKTKRINSQIFNFCLKPDLPPILKLI